MSSIDGVKATKLLRVCEAAAGKLSDDQSGEALHDLRVGLRRLRAELKAAGGLKKHRARLKRVFVMTGPWRDAQIEADWTRAYAEKEDRDWALEPLLRELSESLEHGREDVLPPLARRFERAAVRLKGRLSRGIEVRLPRKELRRLAEEAAARLAAVSSVADSRRLHKARIAVKKLRYALELVEPDAKKAGRLRELQGLLGDLHDRDSIAAMLETAKRAGVAEPGALTRAKAQAEAEKKELFRRLRGRWLDGRARFLENIV